MTALAIPSVPPLPAGHVVQLADLQALASAASFLLAPPMTKALDETGGQTIGTSSTTINFTNNPIDIDGAWTAGNPSRFTIQTPGWYKIRYAISLDNIGGVGPFVSWVKSTTGANNPAGAGVVSSPFWSGYSPSTASGANVFLGAAGLWPFYLYTGDYLQVSCFGAASGAVTNIADPAGGSPFGGSWFSIEYKSVM